MRPAQFRGQDGFTLVELMVAMSIFLLILVGIFQVFDPSRNAYQVSERKLDVQQNARVAMDRMARQIRMTGYFPENIDNNTANDLSNPIQIATESAFSVAGDLDNTGASSAYTFCLDSQGLKRIQGTIGNAAAYNCANGTVMAESVTALTFAYFDSANNPVPNPPTGPFNLDAQGLGAAPSFASVAQRSIVRRVVIMVTARETAQGQTQTYTLTSDVRLRNP
jgi:prepilin-type N-terminal cleavage/methylation domain-containing protein